MPKLTSDLQAILNRLAPRPTPLTPAEYSKAWVDYGQASADYAKALAAEPRDSVITDLVAVVQGEPDSVAEWIFLMRLQLTAKRLAVLENYVQAETILSEQAEQVDRLGTQAARIPATQIEIVIRQCLEQLLPIGDHIIRNDIRKAELEMEMLKPDPYPQGRDLIIEGHHCGRPTEEYELGSVCYIDSKWHPTEYRPNGRFIVIESSDDRIVMERDEKE